MDTTTLSRELKTETTVTKQITYRCLAGFNRTLDIEIGQELDTIDNFVAFDSGRPTCTFLPYCEDCKVAQIRIKNGDDVGCNLIKMCTLTKVTKINVEFID